MIRVSVVVTWMILTIWLAVSLAFAVNKPKYFRPEQIHRLQADDKSNCATSNQVDGGAKLNPFSTFSLYYLSNALARLADPAYSVRAKQYAKITMSYQNFVDLTKQIIPSPVFYFYRMFSRVNVRWVAEASAWWMRQGLFNWLVGQVSPYSVNITRNSLQENWKSGVKIEKCKYLEGVRCKTACVYLCKLPTEDLFNRQFNLPLHMKPNFTDLSCELSFGISPPINDPVFEEPCFQNCSMNQKVKPTNPPPSF